MSERDRAKEAAKKAGLKVKVKCFEQEKLKLTSKKRKGRKKWNAGISYRGKG